MAAGVWRVRSSCSMRSSLLEQARPHAARATDPPHARRHRLFGAPGQSSKEGLNTLLNLPRPLMAVAFFHSWQDEQIFGVNEQNLPRETFNVAAAIQRAMLTSNDYEELAARCTELASESS